MPPPDVKKSLLVVFCLLAGPAALPFVWFSGRLSRLEKALITGVTLALTLLLGAAMLEAGKKLLAYYRKAVPV